MRKRMKSLFALGLAVCMLVGCGSQAGKQDSSMQTDTKETESSSTVSVQESQQEESQYPEYLNLESARPIVKEGEEVTLKIAVRRDTQPIDINETWAVKFIEEQLNINLEIIELTNENLAERKSLMLMSDDLPDMMICLNINESEIVKYGVEGGQFLPISDYLSYELTPNLLATVEEYEAACIANTAPDGKMYTIPTIYSSAPGSGGTIGSQRIWIDTRYMNAAGYEEAPTTLDEFVEMLRDIKALDPADFGVDEIWPLVAHGHQEWQLFQNAFGWVTSNRKDPTKPVWDLEKEEIVVPCMEEKWADYVTLLNTLYTEGLIHPDYYTMDGTAARALMTEGKVAVMGDAAPYLTREEDWNEYIAATPLSSEWNDTAVVTKGSSYSLGAVVISASTEYPELCLRLLDYIYSPEGCVYFASGCPADSEDTLGIIGGFELNEDGQVVHVDVESGKYANYYDYTSGAILMWAGAISNADTAALYIQELAGVENPSYGELDLTNPDDYYRYSLYIANDEYRQDPLPNMYMSEEDTEQYTDLQTVIKNYVDTETAKFVVGQRPLSELDDYFEELKALGIDEYLELITGLYADYERPEQ